MTGSSETVAGNSSDNGTLSGNLGGSSMTRTIAFRASALFVVLTILFGAVGLGSHAVVAEAMFLIAGSLCALLLFFALVTPDHASVPVRVRRFHTHR
jgi:hypothetical protein